MQLTPIQGVSGNILEINSEKLKSGNGNFEIIRAEFFRVGNVLVAHGTVALLPVEPYTRPCTFTCLLGAAALSRVRGATGLCLRP